MSKVFIPGQLGNMKVPHHWWYINIFQNANKYIFNSLPFISTSLAMYKNKIKQFVAVKGQSWTWKFWVQEDLSSCEKYDIIPLIALHIQKKIDKLCSILKTISKLSSMLNESVSFAASSRQSVSLQHPPDIQ